jgi:Tol biopolymer transport system component
MVPLSILHRAASRDRRITGAVAALVVVALALGVGLASQRRLSAAPLHGAALPTAQRHASLGRLAYGINGDIYVADRDGRNPVRIANGAPAARACGYSVDGRIWSPDGRHLAYRGGTVKGVSCQGRQAMGNVNISDPAGHRVASFPGDGWLISWSPDSTRVATWVRLGHTIGIYGLDGVRQALLTVPPRLTQPGDFDPVWSSDGTSLVLPPGVEIPIDGSAPLVLPADDPRGHYGAWPSPDGSRVAYLHQTTQGRTALIVAEPDGSHARVLIHSGAQRSWGFAWSPTADRIAFESRTGGGKTVMGPTELRMVDVATGRVTSLVGTGGADTLAVIEFSPVGDQILFTRTGAKGVTSLWSVHADGSDPHLLVAAADWGDWQALSPTLSGSRLHGSASSRKK